MAQEEEGEEGQEEVGEGEGEDGNGDAWWDSDADDSAHLVKVWIERGKEARSLKVEKVAFGPAIWRCSLQGVARKCGSRAQKPRHVRYGLGLFLTS